MKKIFTASLVAMMAVTAANADIASTGYVDQRTGDTSKLETTATELTGAVNELKTQLGTVSSTAGDAATKSELTAVQEALEGAIETEKGRIDAADLTAVGAEGSFISSVSQTDGKVAAAPTAFVSNIETGKDSLVAPQTKAVVDYVGAKMGVINTNMSGIQGSISELESGVGKLADDLEAEATTRANADTAINSKIGEVAEGKTVVGLIDEAKQAASGANTELAGRVTANENAIKGINDSDAMKSGVNAATVAQVETNKTDIANIKTEQTTQNNNISALQTSLAEGGATAKAIEEAKKAGTDATAALNAYKETNDAAVNANTTAISNLDSTYATDAELNTAKSDIKTAYEAADAETLAGAKQYADGLAGNYATAEQGTKADTAVQREQVGMAESFAVSDACKVNGVICSLTIKGTGTGAVAQWEVVK